MTIHKPMGPVHVFLINSVKDEAEFHKNLHKIWKTWANFIWYPLQT